MKYISLVSLPNFHPTGLPVQVVTVEWSAAHEGIVIASGGGGLTIYLPMTRRMVAAPARACNLDLFDAATRDRIARWAAGRVGLEVGSTAPRWRFVPGDPAVFRPGCWELSTGVGDEVYLIRTGHEAVCGLDGSDPAVVSDEDRTRVVDAVALGRTALHVGGLEP